MDSEVFSRIRGYLAEQLEVDPEKITQMCIRDSWCWTTARN